LPYAKSKFSLSIWLKKISLAPKVSIGQITFVTAVLSSLLNEGGRLTNVIYQAQCFVREETAKVTKYVNLQNKLVTKGMLETGS
jgi:hypothetical protein